MTAAIERVSVVGTGVIGSSWATLFLAAGLEVDVYDPADDAERRVVDYVTRAWPTVEALGLTEKGKPDALRFHSNLGDAVNNANFVQESVPERLPLKHASYAELEQSLPPDAIVASSSSGLMLSDMQKGWRDPSRFLLAHPFNPPHLIPLVELQVNERTRDGLLEDAERLYTSLGKVTVRLRREVPGHVANRLQAALWREAIHLVTSGVASVEDVDKAVWAGPGLRWAAMGPHMLFNLGAGEGGMATFCDRLGPSFEDWWADLGTPHITPEVTHQLAEGLAAESRSKSLVELADIRDRAIIAMLQALAPVER